jgi:AcrR family transcriptional regulator
VGKGEETRAVILDEALQVASRSGFGGLSVGLLAERTGMSKSGLFAHFRSMDQLQLQVLARARDRFVDVVVRPALTAPRGEPRVRAVFEKWLRWTGEVLVGGCIFVGAAVELDEQPGELRDALVGAEQDWLDLLATVAATAVAEGHFDPELDPGQFAFEVHALMLGHHHASRLMRDPLALIRTRRSFEALIHRARSVLTPD